jgi:hypothetical protein
MTCAGSRRARCDGSTPWVARRTLARRHSVVPEQTSEPLHGRGPRAIGGRRVQHPSHRVHAGAGGRLPASHAEAAVQAPSRRHSRPRPAARRAGTARRGRRAPRADRQGRLTGAQPTRAPLSRRALRRARSFLSLERTSGLRKGRTRRETPAGCSWMRQVTTAPARSSCTDRSSRPRPRRRASRSGPRRPRRRTVVTSLTFARPSPLRPRAAFGAPRRRAPSA